MKILKAGWDEASGTSYSGYTVCTTKDILTANLGIEPAAIDDKAYWAWTLKLENGTVFTIYDWTNGGRLGEGQFYDYHIGSKGHGLSEDVINALKEIGLTVKKNF